MPQIRVFNPAYTPRSFFAGGPERGKTRMAHHRHHRVRYRRRRNPLGLSTATVKDAAFVAGGAIGSPLVARLLNQSGWLDVAATGVAAVALSYAGKMVAGESAAEEVLKGGLAATIIKAIKQAGFGGSLGLGSYVQNYFPIPTSSDAYGRVSPPIAVLPAATVPSKGMAGYQRYRSRYIR